jgi:hypothetical protein
MNFIFSSLFVKKYRNLSTGVMKRDKSNSFLSFAAVAKRGAAVYNKSKLEERRFSNMKKVSVHEMKAIIQNPDSKFNYFAWPSLARLHDGTLAAVCSGFRIGHVCPFGKVVMAKNTDDGKTFSKPRQILWFLPFPLFFANYYLTLINFQSYLK